MARKPRPLDRTKQHERDTRLYFIATEGELTEKQYFDGVFSSPRDQFHFLTTPGPGSESQGCSSPQHVIDRLNEIKKSTDCEPGDEFWLVIDTDCYTKPNKLRILPESRVKQSAEVINWQSAIQA